MIYTLLGGIVATGIVSVLLFFSRRKVKNLEDRLDTYKELVKQYRQQRDVARASQKDAERALALQLKLSKQKEGIHAEKVDPDISNSLLIDLLSDSD